MEEQQRSKRMISDMSEDRIHSNSTHEKPMFGALFQGDARSLKEENWNQGKNRFTYERLDDEVRRR